MQKNYFNKIRNHLAEAPFCEQNPRSLRIWRFLFCSLFPLNEHVFQALDIDWDRTATRKRCVVFGFVYLIFHRLRTDEEVKKILASHILGFHRVKRDREIQNILDWEDKVPEVARLTAMESKPEAGQMPGFQRSCKDQPKTNSGRSQFRCQQISYGFHTERIGNALFR